MSTANPDVRNEIVDAIDALLDEADFSGVVQVSRGADVVFERARGLADRAHAIPNTMETQFGMASGSKAFTALAVMALVSDGLLTLDTSVREVLGEIGDQLELIDPRVTVGHLLSHTSGIGDYLDEEADGDISDYAMPVSVHEFVTTRDFLVALRGHPKKFEPGEKFAYCNGGFVVLALVVEAASAKPFHDVVTERVITPAGMTATGYPRSDQLPGTAALGYVPSDDAWRTNVFHLPVRGSGDGGAFTTVADMARFWSALYNGRILARPVIDEMVMPRTPAPSGSARYGLGFWLHPDEGVVELEGYDAGVSFRSAYAPASQVLFTVISNTSAGAWPVVKLLERNATLLAP